MADNLGDFAPALANQSQQQTVSVSSTVSAAAIKHIDNAGVQVDADIRSALNLTAGNDIALSFSDDAVGDKVDVTVAFTRHIESGSVSVASSGTTATFSFSSTYSVAPKVVWSFSNSDVVDFERDASSIVITTTGATITFNAVAMTRTVYWLSEGAN